jgi:hypothetical protein
MKKVFFAFLMNLPVFAMEQQEESKNPIASDTKNWIDELMTEETQSYIQKNMGTEIGKYGILIIDSGMQTKHEMLSRNYIDGINYFKADKDHDIDESDYEGEKDPDKDHDIDESDDEGEKDPDKQSGHGTAVAGVITQIYKNAPLFVVHAGRGLKQLRFYRKNIINQIIKNQYKEKNKKERSWKDIKVINLSFGSDFDETKHLSQNNKRYEEIFNAKVEEGRLKSEVHAIILG